MKIHEYCSCGAQLLIDVEASTKPGTPSWPAMLHTVEAWRVAHWHHDHDEELPDDLPPDTERLTS